MTSACYAARIHKDTAYQRRRDDPEFARAWDEAVERSVEAAEHELYRRAVKGTLRPVFQGGEKVGVVREYSDTCLIFMLKAQRPAKYREPKGETTINVTPAALSAGQAKAALKAIEGDPAADE